MFDIEYHEPASILIQKIASANNVSSENVKLFDFNGKEVQSDKPLTLNSRPNMLLASF